MPPELDEPKISPPCPLLLDELAAPPAPLEDDPVNVPVPPVSVLAVSEHPPEAKTHAESAAQQASANSGTLRAPRERRAETDARLWEARKLERCGMVIPWSADDGAEHAKKGPVARKRGPQGRSKRKR